MPNGWGFPACADARGMWPECALGELMADAWGSANAGQPFGNLPGRFQCSSRVAGHSQIKGTDERTQQMFSRKLTTSIVAGAAALAVAGGAYGIATSSSGTATASTTSPAASSSPAAGHGSSGGGSNARSGPAAGGSSGTVSSVSTSGFTITTSAGQKVTVDEASSTTYQEGTSPASASAITTGEPVLVLGTTNSTTITATQVTVQPAGSEGSAASSAAGVVPFQRGAPATSKQAGQIPASYSQGSGTIVSGTAANKATEAALAAYPGGVVDRVVKLSNGEYEVHYIGVNWPHHVFVNQDFKVIGAN